MPEQFFTTTWICENGHTTEARASIIEVHVEDEHYSWIGSSSWDMCDNCSDCPTDEQTQDMRDDITRQVIWHYWPEVAAEFQRMAEEART